MTGRNIDRDEKDRDPAIVLGISGASGAVYGVRTLERLRDAGIKTHLIMSKAARITLACETNYKIKDLEAIADRSYRPDDVAAPISSGSFQTMGMIVAPCSIRSLSEIASGVTSGLLSRAADVTLKQKRRLVLLVRETPLHSGHLKSMLAVSDMGGVIMPPVPAMYSLPKTLDDLIEHTVGRALDLFGIDTKKVRRWNGPV